MEALHGKNMPSPDDTHSTKINSVEEFE
ncbi:MAG: hypothetical protein ACI8PD_001298, partial [Nitrospinales bacterium]